MNHTQNNKAVYIIAAHPYYTPLYVTKYEYVASQYKEITPINFYNVIDPKRKGVKCIFDRNSELLDIF